MERVGGEGRWRNLKQRFRFKGMGCCGSPWGFRDSNQMNEREEDEDVAAANEREEDEDVAAAAAEEEEEEEEIMVDVAVENVTEESGQNPAMGNEECVGQAPAGSSMNLATALEAERHFRAAAQGFEAASLGSSDKPSRVSLMRLLEERDDSSVGAKEGDGLLCCVCMGRRKGAAFIPCGHTFCRVCSRELWLNRGSCPLCNRSILEILDIF